MRYFIESQPRAQPPVPAFALFRQALIELRVLLQNLLQPLFFELQVLVVECSHELSSARKISEGEQPVGFWPAKPSDQNRGQC